MTSSDHDIGGARQAQGLRLSSDEALARAKAEEEQRAAYRRAYWQGYAKRVKRIYGSVSPEDYEAVSKRAEDGGRSVWGQVWAESQAYLRGERVADLELAAQQRELITEMRRIGNNINQLAHLGHLDARKHRGLTPRNGDRLGQEALRQFSLLEAKVRLFGARAGLDVE